MSFLDQAKEWMLADRHNNHSSNALNAEATAAAASALIAIAEELRRSNEDRALFYTTMREFFEKVTEDPFEKPHGDGSPAGSGQPAAAPDGQEGGEPQ